MIPVPLIKDSASSDNVNEPKIGKIKMPGMLCPAPFYQSYFNLFFSITCVIKI